MIPWYDEQSVLQWRASTSQYRTIDRNINLEHNARQPISKLPNELLSEIFREASSILFLPLTSTKENDQQVPISQVCTRWRNVALSRSFLWNSLWINRGFEFPWLLTEVLKRSRQALLAVSFECRISSKTLERGLLGILFREGFRIQELHMYRVPPELLADPVWSTLQASAGKLESFELTGLGGNSPALDDVHQARLDAFTSAFSENFPALTTFTIQHCIPFSFSRWTLPSTLRYLEMREILGGPPEVTFGALLRFLGRLPNLERLILYRVLGHCVMDPIDCLDEDHQVVQLPKLKWLHLEDYGWPYLELMEYLNFPPLEFFILESPNERRDGGLSSYTPISRRLSADLALRTISVRLAEVDPGIFYHFVLRAWYMPYRLRDLIDMAHQSPRYFEKGDVHIGIDIVDEDAWEHDIPTLRDWLSDFPVSGTEALHLRCDTHSKPILAALVAFRRMQHLHTLCVESRPPLNDTNDVRAVIRILDDPESVIFPGLDTLCLGGLYFDTELFQSFVKTLEMRQQTASIKKLVVERCWGLNEDSIKALQDVAQLEVDWDGLTSEDGVVEELDWHTPVD